MQSTCFTRHAVSCRNTSMLQSRPLPNKQKSEATQCTVKHNHQYACTSILSFRFCLFFESYIFCFWILIVLVPLHWRYSFSSFEFLNLASYIHFLHNHPSCSDTRLFSVIRQLLNAIMFFSNVGFRFVDSTSHSPSC